MLSILIYSLQDIKICQCLRALSKKLTVSSQLLQRHYLISVHNILNFDTVWLSCILEGASQKPTWIVVWRLWMTLIFTRVCMNQSYGGMNMGIYPEADYSILRCGS
ncbi:hypothetical protein ATO46_06225 [Aeromonas schubertii]|nr:hypothetical protein ATO46_06225 [Aeromonas schubertii]